MPRTPPRYTDDQREALAHAALDLGIAQSELKDHAARGVLTMPDGTKLAPFEVNPNTIYNTIKRERDKRLGRAKGTYDDRPHEDAVEDLRRRLVRVTALKLSRLERQKDPEWKDLTESARALREIAALAPKPEQRGPRPGRTADGKDRGEQETRRTQLGAALLGDFRKGEGGQQNGPADGEPVVPAPVNGG